jgi:cysteine-rich repeat protein
MCLDCGNGERETGEECDDGNSDNGDGCSDDCLIEVCGAARRVCLFFVCVSHTVRRFSEYLCLLGWQHDLPVCRRLCSWNAPA